jgi:hypothetical protein
MRVSTRSACIVLAATGVTAAALHTSLAPGDVANATPPGIRPAPAASAGGVAANLHFTDARGNPRNPTAAEARAAAQAFRRDLDRLAGPFSGRPNVRTLPSGAVAATVATSRISLLYAVENEDGTIAIGHSTPDGDPSVPARTANELPEK